MRIGGTPSGTSACAACAKSNPSRPGIMWSRITAVNGRPSPKATRIAMRPASTPWASTTSAAPTWTRLSLTILRAVALSSTTRKRPPRSGTDGTALRASPMRGSAT